MGDLPRLTAALDRVTRAGGLVSRHPSKRFPLWLDEYGYQTNPPDRVLGVSASLQSAYLQQGAYIAWANPRVRNLSQYVWRDEPLTAGGAGWQSGLRYDDGRAKPSLTTFRHPFWAFRTSSTTVRLWGQVRPGSRAIVRLQRRSPSGAWVTLTNNATDLRGFFRRDVRIRSSATFRFTYGGGTSSSRRVGGR